MRQVKHLSESCLGWYLMQILMLIMQSLKIPLVAPSLGGVESLITRPATTTHVGMPQEERQVMFSGLHACHGHVCNAGLDFKR